MHTKKKELHRRCYQKIFEKDVPIFAVFAFDIESKIGRMVFIKADRSFAFLIYRSAMKNCGEFCLFSCTVTYPSLANNFPSL